MSNIEKRARELLAKAYRATNYPPMVHESHSLMHGRQDRRERAALEAIIAALTAPDGYVLVPVEPTEAMIEAICTEHGSGGWPQGYGRYAQHIRREHAGEGYRAALAARPEVSP